MLYENVRRKVLETTLTLHREGLIPLTSGNVSARASEKHIAITPRSIPYETMTPEDVVIVDLDGGRVDGRQKPSSETPMHTLLYRERPDVNAVVHAHSPYAVAFSVVGKGIPIICIEALVVNGPIPVAAYACPGTEEQGRVALKALAGPPTVTGVLLRNHGVLTVAPDLDRAYNIAYRLELSARIFHLASQIGEPVALTEEQIAEIQQVYANK
jgi:L-ribulose-5-phosphate 4-epimerase